MERFLTIAEAAETLRLSKQSVRALIHRGDLAAVRVGPAVNSPMRISERELRRWLHSDPEDAA